MTSLQLSTSKARKNFKEMIGQTNHFLITILVGLDGVKTGSVTISPTFSTSWNPQNVETSARRSRHFAIKATLAWCIDSLDAYYVMACESPVIIQDGSIIRTVENSRSIFQKFNAINQRYLRGQVDVEKAMMELAITWRNRLVHYASDNTIKPAVRRTLQSNATYLHSTYQGLDVDDLLNNYDEMSSPPHFKEITALIRAVHTYVEALDKSILQVINYQSYVDELIRRYVNEKGESDRQKRINSIWSRDSDTITRKLVNIICSQGFEQMPSAVTASFQISSTHPLVLLGVKGALATY